MAAEVGIDSLENFGDTPLARPDQAPGEQMVLRHSGALKAKVASSDWGQLVGALDWMLGCRSAVGRDGLVTLPAPCVMVIMNRRPPAMEGLILTV